MTARSTRRALLLGAAAVGALDLLDALIFFGLRGVPPERILQSIAAGVLGRSAFTGGGSAAALGLVLHFVIAALIVATYLGAARLFPSLARRPVAYGALYGVAVYLVMNWVVIPLSAAVAGPRPLAVVVNGVAIHVLGVGIPAALAARAAGGGRVDFG
jgi:hypothetical protein